MDTDRCEDRPAKTKIDHLAAHCERALNAVCFGRPEDTETAIDQYFTADYEQTTDGETSKHAQFVDHIAKLRGTIKRGHIHVIEAIQEGSRIAERHTVHITRTNGQEAVLEVYLFGEMTAEGKLHRVHEITRVVSGADRATDQELARVR